MFPAGEEEYTVGVTLEPRFEEVVDNLQMAAELLQQIEDTQTIISSNFDQWGASIRAATRDYQVFANLNDRVRATLDSIVRGGQAQAGQVSGMAQDYGSVMSQFQQTTGLGGVPTGMPYQAMPQGWGSPYGGGQGYYGPSSVPSAPPPPVPVASGYQGGGGGYAAAYGYYGGPQGPYGRYGAYWYRDSLSGALDEPAAAPGGGQAQGPTVRVARMVVQQIEYAPRAKTLGPVSGQGTGVPTVADGMPTTMPWLYGQSGGGAVSDVAAPTPEAPSTGGPETQRMNQQQAAHRQQPLLQQMAEANVLRAVAPLEGRGPLGNAVADWIKVRALGGIRGSSLAQGFGRGLTRGGFGGIARGLGLAGEEGAAAAGAEGGIVGGMGAAAGAVAIPLIAGYALYKGIQAYNAFRMGGRDYEIATGAAPGEMAAYGISRNLGDRVAGFLDPLGGSAEQRRQARIASLQYGFRPGSQQQQTLQDFILDTTVQGFMDASQSVDLFNTAVSRAGASTIAVESSLDLLRRTAVGTGASFQAITQAFVTGVGGFTAAGYGPASVGLAALGAQSMAGASDIALQQMGFQGNMAFGSPLEIFAAQIAGVSPLNFPGMVQQQGPFAGYQFGYAASMRALSMVPGMAALVSTAQSGGRVSLADIQQNPMVASGIAGRVLSSLGAISQDTAADAGLTAQWIYQMLSGRASPTAVIRRERAQLGGRQITQSLVDKEPGWLMTGPAFGLFQSDQAGLQRSVGTWYRNYLTANVGTGRSTIPFVQEMLDPSRPGGAIAGEMGVRLPSGDVMTLADYLKRHPDAHDLRYGHLRFIHGESRDFLGALKSGDARTALELSRREEKQGGGWMTAAQMMGVSGAALGAGAGAARGSITLDPRIQRWFSLQWGDSGTNLGPGRSSTTRRDNNDNAGQGQGDF